ncbi:ScbA/BarX family gamma-butyrolactone biosynthesis protein [Streptomyces sp. CNQ085]|uniref:ScbA/BarX family gamma-butyrolactone biosynthesis protein n=1 Tax=Streptomyces sp. CNQ085 TaxID=2886944 RepID=UPI001F508041|nr:ScbA/BarX family gamma-butyrolactone biosynthesis protein [Streptomyces sp. CNQ085]MCI0385826.1 hypothetical protein [Streptomyces sp. CNQ085]
MRAFTKADSPVSTSAVAGPELFEQTVPRRLVHRAAVSEVLITGARRAGGVHQVGAQWSRGHSYYSPVSGRWHDPMLLAETIRQAGILLGHEVLDVPLGHCFLSKHASFEMSEDGARLDDRPAEIVLMVRVHDVTRRGRSVSYEYEVECHRDGRHIGSGRMGGSCVPQALYRRLRGDRVGAVLPKAAADPVVPELVGRADEADVVLGETGVAGVWTLRAEPDHPVLFDHPVDHIPGMVVMEAGRQAALAALGQPGGLLVGCAGEFEQYVEFDPLCLVSADVVGRDARGRDRVRVSFHQGGALAARCDIDILPTA